MKKNSRFVRGGLRTVFYFTLKTPSIISNQSNKRESSVDENPWGTNFRGLPVLIVPIPNRNSCPNEGHIGLESEIPHWISMLKKKKEVKKYLL